MATNAVRGRRQASRPIPAAATSSTTAIPLMRTGLSQVPSSRTAISFTGVGAASTATEPTAISGEAAGRDIAAATAWPTPSAADADSTPASACVDFRGVPMLSLRSRRSRGWAVPGGGDTLPG